MEEMGSITHLNAFIPYVILLIYRENIQTCILCPAFDSPGTTSVVQQWKPAIQVHNNVLLFNKHKKLTPKER